MPEPETAQPSSVATVIDDELASAEGFRTTAAWIATAFGGVPVVAAATALIKGPGDAGFDTSQLLAGVALVATGAFLGVMGFAWVRAPVGTNDGDLVRFDVMRILGFPFPTYNDLLRSISRVRSAIAQMETMSLDVRADATARKARAASLDALAKSREAKDPSSQATLNARTEADTASRDAEKAEERATLAEGELRILIQQLARREAFRRDAYRLHAGDVIRVRFGFVIAIAAVATAMIAAGVVFLAVAPEEQAATTPELVTLSLTDAGKDALGCDVDELQAIRIGVDERTSSVITLPTPGCTARTADFVSGEPEPWGEVTLVGPIAGSG